MKQDLAQQWVAELRSGKISQGQSGLGDVHGRRCCLGVECDIAVREGVIPFPSYNEFFDNIEFAGTPSYLPEAVRQWGSFLSIDPYFRIDYLDNDGLPTSTVVYLSVLNDHNYTFDQIADCIEYFWKEL